MTKNLTNVLLLIGFVIFVGSSAQAQTVTITSNFNGTSISAGNYIYFNSVINPSGLSSTQPTTITLSNASISFTNNGQTYNISLPGSTITYVPGGSTATTTYSGGMYTTTVPLNTSGNEFLTALPWQVPVNFSGGTNPVIFTGTFSSSTPGVTGNVQFSAAVYTSLPTDPNQLGIKVVDDNNFGGSYHAGTPVTYRNNVVGGARGGGGSNFTGSYSATGHFTSSCCAVTPTPTPTMPPPGPTPEPVPEPTTIILLGSGLLTLAGNAIRKRKM